MPARARDARGRYVSTNAGNPNSWRRKLLSTAMSIAKYGSGANTAYKVGRAAYDYGASKFKPVGPKGVSTIKKQIAKKKKKIREPKRKAPPNEVAQSTQTGFNYKFKKRHRRVNDKLGWKYIQQGRGASVVSCNEGQQNYFAVQPILSILQMNAASSSNDDAFDVLPWNLNPFQYMTGSAKFAQNTDTTKAQYKRDTVYLSKVSGFMDILNCSAVNHNFVDIYWLVAKQTSVADPSTAFTEAITDDSFTGTAGTDGQVVSVQVTGIAAGTNPTAGFVTANTYGIKPTMFPSFNKRWKVIKKDHLVLAPGEQRRTYATFHYNENQTKIDWANLYTGITANLVKANRTIYPFIVFRGASCIVRDTAGGTSERLSYSRVECAANYQWTYHWHPVKDNIERFSYTRVNPYFLTDGQAGAVERTLQDDQQVQKATDLNTITTVATEGVL